MSTVSVSDSVRESVAPVAGANRIPAFDFTKGALVLFMVLYHWLNYFYGPWGEFYKYLRFLTPSFIFITGFLISHVHFAKYGIGSVKLSKRLFVRGLKLLAVFIGLNLLICILRPDSYRRALLSDTSLLPSIGSVFGSGNPFTGGVEKIAAFAILVPISYLLILSALLLLACRWFKYAFHALCALLLLSMIVLDLQGIESTNLELVTIGVFGVVSGYMSTAGIQRLLIHPWTIVAAYCAYLAAITFWNVSLYLQMIGACLTTTLIYMLGVKGGAQGLLQRRIELLGKYSLFGYVAQIAILQLLSAGLHRFHLGFAALGASLVAGFALTILAVETMHSARAKWRTVDSWYRAVFA